VIDKLSVTTVYESTSQYPVSAGIGQFNGSLVQKTIDTANGYVSYWILASTYGIINNPEFSIPSNPISCGTNTTDCDSYLFPGGIQTVFPSLNSSDPNPYIIIYDSPAVQMDFIEESDLFDTFSIDECILYGNESSKVGIKLCIKPSARIQGAVTVGMSWKRSLKIEKY
jgi:hypothetical protein